MTTLLEKGFLASADTAPSATEVAKTLYKTPTLLTSRTRCGKAKCHCNAGHLHGPYHVMYWREGVVQRRRYVPADELPAVQAILEERRNQQRLDRLRHAQSLRMWRQIGHLVADVEAHVRETQEQQ